VLAHFVKLLEFVAFHRLLRGGAAHVWRDEVLPLMGILRGGIPAPAFSSPMRPQRNTFHLFFFGKYISGKQIMSIQDTLLTVTVKRGK